jgi:hypothetical protein
MWQSHVLMQVKIPLDSTKWCPVKNQKRLGKKKPDMFETCRAF